MYFIVASSLGGTFLPKGYEGNSQLAVHVDPTIRLITGTPFRGTFPHHRLRGESPTCYVLWLIPSLNFRNPI